MDAVRTYLSQIGKTPLLTREEELDLARRLEQAREHYRRGLLGADFILRAAVMLLDDVGREQRRLQEAVDMPAADAASKKQALRRLQVNLQTLHAAQLTCSITDAGASSALTRSAGYVKQ